MKIFSIVFCFVVTFFAACYLVTADNTLIPLDEHPDCPVCCDNWAPIPICGHSLADNTPQKPINGPAYLCIRESLSIDKIKEMVNDINQNTKPVCIDVAWYFKESSQGDILRILSTIDKKRVIALAI
ncbi:MAG: hypothetical protein LBC74_05215 [Planctomycetaceae bacterium]|jgi:hypothetical protein|nr:hypothetical protein [Planctomycetaceae bacterium]